MPAGGIFWVNVPVAIIALILTARAKPAANGVLFLLMMVFFGGFGVASQWSGRIYDAKGVRAAAIPGCALAARADQVADALSQSGGGSATSFGDASGRAAQRAFEAVQHD